MQLYYWFCTIHIGDLVGVPIIEQQLGGHIVKTPTTTSIQLNTTSTAVGFDTIMTVHTPPHPPHPTPPHPTQTQETVQGSVN